MKIKLILLMNIAINIILSITTIWLLYNNLTQDILVIKDPILNITINSSINEVLSILYDKGIEVRQKYDHKYYLDDSIVYFISTNSGYIKINTEEYHLEKVELFFDKDKLLYYFVCLDDLTDNDVQNILKILTKVNGKSDSLCVSRNHQYNYHWKGKVSGKYYFYSKVENGIGRVQLKIFY